MGTRSLIYFEEVIDGKPITYVVIYQQYDGCPGSVGLILAHFLKQKRIVNGIPIPCPEGIANGFGCLVAQFITREKKEVGMLYIQPLESSSDGVDWEYHVIYDKKIAITIKFINNEKSSDRMSIDQFLQYCCDNGNHDIKDIDKIIRQNEEDEIVRGKVRKEQEKSIHDKEYTQDMLEKNIDKIMNEHPNSKKRYNYKSWD